MVPGDTAQGLAVALGIGLLVGLERERRQREGTGRGPAGLRTFALVALLGGLAATTENNALVVVAGVFVAGGVLVAYAFGTREDPGLTTETALMVTFILGVLARDEPALAAGIAVVVTSLLATRDQLHRFVREVISEQELHDLLLFAAAVLVVYPLVPDRQIGPWDGINPHRVWLLVVLVMSVSGAGYLALRLLGPRFGLPLAGLAGGFISSAATTASMGGLSRTNPAIRPAAEAGAVLSNVATVIQLAIIVGATSRELLDELVPSIAFAAVAALLFGAVAMLRLRGMAKDGSSAPARRAFDVKGALVFAASISLITLASSGIQEWLGADAVPLVAALAGFADAHAAAAGAATLVANGRIEPSTAALAILAGLSTNTITKVIAAFSTGGRAFAIPVLGGLATIIVCAWAGAAPVLF